MDSQIRKPPYRYCKQIFLLTNDKFQVSTSLNFHSFGRYFIVRSIEPRKSPPRYYDFMLCYLKR